MQSHKKMTNASTSNQKSTRNHVSVINYAGHQFLNNSHTTSLGSLTSSTLCRAGADALQLYILVLIFFK